MSETTNEVIPFVVEFDVEYSSKERRDDAIRSALKSMHVNISSFGVGGCYSIKLRKDASGSAIATIHDVSLCHQEYRKLVETYVEEKCKNERNGL